MINFSIKIVLIAGFLLFSLVTSTAQQIDLAKVRLQLDSLPDGPVRGSFKNGIQAFAGYVLDGKMSGEWRDRKSVV